MPLEKRVIEYMLNGGLDRKEHVEAEDPSSLRDATGVRYGQLGRFDRFAGIRTTVDPQHPSGWFWTPDEELHSIVRHRDYPVVIDTHAGLCRLFNNNGTWSYDWLRYNIDATNAPTAFIKRHVIPAQVERRTLSAASFSYGRQGYSNITSSVYSDVLVVAIQVVSAAADSTLEMYAYDLTTGAMIASAIETSDMGNTYAQQGLCSCTHDATGAQGVLITWSSSNAASYTIKCYRYDASTRAFVSVGNLTTNSRYSFHTLHQDTTASTGAGRFFFGYIADTGPSAGYLVVEQRTTGAVTTTHTTTAARGASHDIVIGSNSTLIVSMGTGAATPIYGEPFGTPASVVTLGTLAATATGNGVYAARESSASYTDSCIVWVNEYETTTASRYGVRVFGVEFDGTISAPAGVTGTLVPQCSVVGQPFTYSGRAYAVISGETEGLSGTWATTPLDSLFVVRSSVDIATGNGTVQPVARIVHDRAWATLAQTAYNVIVKGDSVYVASIGDNSPDSITAAAGAVAAWPQTAFLNRVRLEDDCLPLPFAEHAGVTYIAGGVLTGFDGVNAFCAQPLRRPRCYTSGSGTVNVVAIYTYVDAAGNLHRSAPSDVIDIAVGDTVNVELPALDWGTNNVYIGVELYATTAGPGSTYYLVNATGSRDDWDSISGSKYFVFTNVQAGTTADPVLYSTGAGDEELVSEPPPALHHIAVIGDRMWGVDAEDRTRIWFTKPFVAGYAPEWNTACTLIVGDDAEAVEEVGGVPTVFCRKSIWQIYGEGPNALGAGSFAPARRIPVERGCTNRSSVCRTPQGVFFLSGDQFVMLDNSGQIQPVGLPIVPLTVEGAFSCGRAVYDGTHEEVRVHDLATSAAYTYYYSLRHQRWTRRQRNSDEIVARDAVFVGRDMWTINAPTGVVPNVVREYNHDDQTAVQSWDDIVIETPWIKLDALAGYGRIWRMKLPVYFHGGDVTNTTFDVELWYDFDETNGSSVQRFRYTNTEFANWTSQKVNVLDLQPRYQKCSSIKLRITQGGGVAYAIVPLSLRIEYGVRPSSKRDVGTGQRGTPGGSGAS